MAALLVVLFHLGGVLGLEKYFGFRAIDGLFSFGDAGVEFFFVLSGFIITWVHADDIGRPRTLPAYLWKRAIRIYPTYWIIFFGVFFLALATPSLRDTVPHDLPTILKSLALVPQDADELGGTGAPVLVVAWSLQYEMFFYALMAVLVLNRPAGLLLLAALLFNFASCKVSGCTFPRSFFSSNLVLLFAFGSVVAYLCRQARSWRRPLVIFWLGLGAFLATGIIESLYGRELGWIDRRLAFGFFSGLMIAGLVKAEDAGHLQIRAGWVSLLGDASYSLYLIHFPLISVMCKALVAIGLAGESGGAIAFVVILAACIGSSVAFYLLIEKPILRFARTRFGVRRKTSPANAPGHA